jgi:hypothetical protein
LVFAAVQVNHEGSLTPYTYVIGGVVAGVGLGVALVMAIPVTSPYNASYNNTKKYTFFHFLAREHLFFKLCPRDKGGITYI